MKLNQLMSAMFLGTVVSVGLTGCNDGDDGRNGVDGKDASAQMISLQQVARTNSQGFDESAAEIVAYDRKNNRIYTVNSNSGKVDVFNNLGSTMSTDPDQSLDMASLMNGFNDDIDSTSVGKPNSIDVYGDYAVVAVANDTKTDNGWAVFLNTSDFSVVNVVEVGALPDMVTFVPDGSKVLVANEGEPADDYSVDPEGSVSIITVADFSEIKVSFTADDVIDTSKMIMDGYSATNPANKATFSEMVEPEYITVADDGSKAFVALQENNAIAVIDLTNNTVDKIFGLGFKDHSIPGNEMDASQKDGVNIRNWPVMGIYMPDSIASITYNNKNFVLTANEGDDRQDWLDNVTDQTSCEAAGYFFGDDGDGARCIDAFSAKDFYSAENVTLVDVEGNPLAETEGGFGEDNELRRLKFSYHMTAKMNEGNEFTKLYAYGGRSFSIYDAQTGEQVFDSGSFFETKTAQLYGENFNNDNAENAGDDRSDNKGPEPEAITVGTINGKTYAFIGLERTGGIMVYDVSNPYSPEFIQYVNNRDFTGQPEGDATSYTVDKGDLGPEGFKFVSASDSPDGKDYLIVGSEVSGTTTVYEVADLSLN